MQNLIKPSSYPSKSSIQTTNYMKRNLLKVRWYEREAVGQFRKKI